MIAKSNIQGAESAGLPRYCNPRWFLAPCLIALLSGCMAERPYRIRTTPPDAVVSFIPLTYFKLCKRRGIDPYDSKGCNHWDDARDGTVVLMSGRYQWSMDIPGNGPKRGTIKLRAGRFNDSVEDINF
jgi:hypothetical protein